MAKVATSPPVISASARRRWCTGNLIKAFFGSNALIAVVALTLITIFLFREGIGFFGQNLRNLRVYRRAGLEYVDIMRASANAHASLSRDLNSIQQIAQELNHPRRSLAWSNLPPPSIIRERN